MQSKKEFSKMKIIFDVFFSFLIFVFITPLIVIIALLIKIKMPDGPIFFVHKRVGQNGELFSLIKFRTMTVSHSGSSISIKGESRITPFGAFLRRYKLDELPEFINVLKGEMSIVGPRPDVSGYMDRLEGDDIRILNLKPGITGPASLKYINEEELLADVDDPIKYNNDVIFPDKVRINLLYLNNWSICLDIKIIWHTIFRREFKEENYFSKL